MIDGDNDITTAIQELSDLELMELRKLATNKTSLRDHDLHMIATIAAEYVRRGCGVSDLFHLDVPDRRGFGASRRGAAVI